MLPVYYCLGHPYKTISSGDLKFYAGFKKVTYETIEHYDFVDPQGCSWRSPYQTRNNLDYLQLKIVKINRLMDTRDMPKELGLFYVTFLNVRIYIQCYQFIIV